MTHSSYRTASSLPEVTLTSFITTASHSLTTLQPSPQVRTSQVAIIIHQYFHRQLCLCRPFPISFITTNTPSSSFLVCSTKPSNKSYSDPSSRSISTFIHYPPLLVPSTSLFLFFFSGAASTRTIIVVVTCTTPPPEISTRSCELVPRLVFLAAALL